MSRDHRARIMRDSVKLLEWENKIAALTLKAYRRWLPSVRDAVLPTFDDQGGLIAAAFTEPVLPPNVEAITLTQAQWDAIMDETFVPGIEDLMARRVMDRLREEGWDIPPGTQLEVVQGITPFSPLTPLTAQAYAIPTVRDWQEAYLSEVRNRMVRTPDAVFREIAADLNEGMSKGEGIRELRARVQQQLVVSGTEIWKRRAETVARTEATGAFNGATHSAAHVAQTVLGIELEKVWVATIDGRTRKTHFAADGQRRGLDGEFKIGRSRLRWPGDPRGAAEEVINCVTGDALVAWPGDHVLNVTRRAQKGTFVQLSTVNGHHLTVTPNHPVLTLAGYVPAGSIEPGQYLVATAVAVTPEVQDGPPRADETFRAARQIGTEQGVVGAAVQFHGDATEGAEVQVVSTNSDLWHKSYPAMKGAFRDSRFYGLRNTERPGAGDSGAERGPGPVVPGLVGAGTRSSDPAGSVGADSERSPLVGGQCGHADTVGLGSRTDRQASLFQSAQDQGTRDPETLAHLQDADALGMQLSEVAHVDRFTGRHQVYNLSTGREWYTANGIALHNCRCTTIELEPDEETPGEYDRQTERGEGDATVRNREGSQQDEIDRRADDGVIRAREDPDGDGSVDGIQAAAGEQEQTMARRTWTGKLAPIGIPTGDGRQIKEGGKITFRPLPLTLSWQKVSAEGHMQSVVVGGITEAAVSADGKSIDGAGFMLETPEALEAVDLLEEKLIGVSIDPTAVVWEMVDANGNAISWEDLEEAYMNGEELEVLDQFAEMEVMGATLVDHPAFKEAQLTLDPVGSEDAPPVEEVEAAARSLVASVSADQAQARTVFEPESFEDPGFEELTPLHITADGRVQGHLAAWNSCHVAVRDKCKQPPRSMTNYAHFHVSSVPTAAGPLAVGHLTVGGGHADPRLGMIPALEHYDDVGSSWAIVRAHEDAFGIAVSGVVDPHATRQQVEKGLQVPLSGDWRGSGGNLELCAALSIITPGFVVPRGYRDEDGTEQSLVAAGAMAPADPEKRTSGRKLEDVMKRAAEAAVLAVYERQARENKARETAAALRAEKSDQTRARARELLNTEA